MNKFTEKEIFSLLQRPENICRLCFCNLEEGIRLYSIFENCIQQTLQFCLWNQLKFIDSDFIPKQICLNCYASLQSASNFLEIIFKSRDIIKKFIEKKEFLDERKGSSSENDEDVPLFDNLEGSSLKDYSSTNYTKTTKVTKRSRDKSLVKTDQETKPKKAGNADLKKITRNTKCCGREFRTKTEYFAHVRSHGVVRKNYECPECDKKYVSHFELKVHLRKHSGERPFGCSFCQKSFIDKRNLKKHEKIHTGKRDHQCLVCEKKFLHLFTLKTHERLHNGEKPFVCENCGKSFNTSTELKIHNRTHTKEKPYKCKNCEKAFCSKAALNTHILVHTGEKRYSCSVCTRKCRTSFDLKTHLRCHSNERPYICQYRNCDKKYKNSSQLNVHLRTHKGEKRHHCMVCFKQFGESNTLRRHMGIHEKNIENII